MATPWRRWCRDARGFRPPTTSVGKQVAGSQFFDDRDGHLRGLRRTWVDLVEVRIATWPVEGDQTLARPRQKPVPVPSVVVAWNDEGGHRDPPALRLAAERP